MKNEHKLVQDLFPSYIDELTTPETSEYIKEHLASCKECQKVLKDMKAKIENENHIDLGDRKIQYAKKVNRKLKALKIMIVIILLVIVGLVIDFDRKAIILRDLQNKRKSVFGLR